MSSLSSLARRQLIVVTGKGGVGKTTIAAALGRLLASHGRKTLLLEIDPRESLHQLLGTEPSGGAVLKAGTRLSAQNLQPRSVVEGLVREKVPIGALAKKIIANPVFQHFADGAPGLKEMAILGYALQTVRRRYRHRADVVVLDAPATGHGASMLAAPLLLADAVAGGQLGDMAKELAAFIANPAHCGVVLVTMAEEMPVQEAIELVEMLKDRMGRPPELVVVNALYPEARADPQADAALKDEVDVSAILNLWRRRREVNERELRRLRKVWPGSLVELPLLPIERGPALLRIVTGRLEEELT